MEIEGFGIAPLDMISLMNGLLKWEHPYGTVSHEEFYVTLEWLNAIYGSIIHVPQWTPNQALEAIDKQKSAGYPHSQIYGHTKGDTLQNMNWDQIMSEFLDHLQVFVATLKDENRKEGKDARLFVPANIIMVAVGNFLFGAQNEAIMNSHSKGSIKIGMETPGSGAYAFWRELYKAEGTYCHTDGPQNDSHFSPVVAMILRDFRKQHLPDNMTKLVNLYYDMAYRMKTLCRGALIEMIGQPTGHTNTASDNSLGYLTLCILHAVRNRMTFDEFKTIHLAIMGDDMIWCDPTGLFTPTKMSVTWNSVGMYLESPSDNTVFWDLQFCGMTPMMRDVEGQSYLLYVYQKERLLSSLNLVKKSASPAQRLMKLVSIATLLFADKEVFCEVKELAYKYAERHHEYMTMNDLMILGYLQDLPQLRLHTGLEPLKTGVFYFSLVNELAKL